MPIWLEFVGAICESPSTAHIGSRGGTIPRSGTICGQPGTNPPPRRPCPRTSGRNVTGASILPIVQNKLHHLPQANLPLLIGVRRRYRFVQCVHHICHPKSLHHAQNIVTYLRANFWAFVPARTVQLAVDHDCCGNVWLGGNDGEKT